MASLNDIVIEGKIYTPVEDTTRISNDVCRDCCFRNSADLCHKANQIIKCDKDDGIHFVPATPRADFRSDTQQIQGWNADLIAVEDLKDQLPGTKYDQDKLQYTLIPPNALAEVARNLTIGLKKYKERDNWKKVPNAEQRYLDALYRHLEAHRRGEIYDPDSSVPDMPHLAAVAVNAMFLLEFMLNPNLKEKGC